MTQSLGLELPTFSELRKEREQATAHEGAAKRRAQARAQARSFEAARLNRLTRDWSTMDTSTAWELRRDLRVLRARARGLARNDDYVKRFLSMVRNNVAGPAGVRLQARARLSDGTLDRALNRAVETAWSAWSHPENCALSGRFSWPEAQRKAIGMVARDGEAVVRTVFADNPFGFALKFYSASWLDEMYCETLPGGNRVIMSVELDPLDRPVAFWLTPPPSDQLYTRSTDRPRRTRVPAEEIIHLFLPDDAVSDDDSQTRGVPWLHTAMKRLRILNGYQEAELIAARIGACKMGFFTEEPAEDEYTGEEDGEHAEAFPLMESAQPGTFGVLPAGYDFKEFAPDHPNSGYEQFEKAVVRGVAAGLDVSYFALANDLKEVNFSTARVGRQQDQDNWRSLQGFLSEHFCRRVYLAWLRSSMMTGALRLQAADFYRLAEARWLPRGWPSVNPKDDAAANKIGLDNGWTTLTEIITAQGGDVEETFDTRVAEQKMIEEKGVKLLTGAPSQPAGPPAADAPEDDEEDA